MCEGDFPSLKYLTLFRNSLCYPIPVLSFTVLVVFVSGPQTRLFVLYGKRKVLNNSYDLYN